MVPAAVDEAIRRIAEDRRSSASQLARIALETMRIAILESGARPDPRDIREVARRISEAQPAMAIVHNVAYLVANLVSEGQDAKAVLDEVRSELDSARERIARTFQKIAPERGTFVTLSYSENVLAALKLANARGQVIRVHVMESQPLLEGRALAQALLDNGVPATVVSDPEGPALLGEASCAIVGADAVLRDASVVNKIGTSGLAVAAMDHAKPFYVVCETLKFDARYDSASWPGSTTIGDSKKVGHGGNQGDSINSYFEVTPGHLITTAVTERGTYAPDVIRTMLTPARERKS